MAGINLGGAFGAGGMNDALFEIAKQRMLEQQLAQAEREREYQRSRDAQADTRYNEKFAYDKQKDTEAKTRQDKLDVLAEEARTQQMARNRFEALKGLPEAEQIASLGEDRSRTNPMIPTETPPGIPAGGQSFQLPANPFPAARIDLGQGVKVRPPSAEAINEQARQDEKRKQDMAVEQARLLEEQKPPQYEVESAFVDRRGRPVSHDKKTDTWYRGGVKISPDEVMVKPSGDGSGSGAAVPPGLVQTIIDHPAVYNDLTPTLRAKVAVELSKQGFDGFGRPMTSEAIGKISQSKSAIAQLGSLRNEVVKNKDYIGPIAGIASLNPYSEAKKIKASIDFTRQNVGKALEGGVLRKEDEAKYKEILATGWDTLDTALFKLDYISQNLERDLQTYIDDQMRGGRAASEFKTPVGDVGPFKVRVIPPPAPKGGGR